MMGRRISAGLLAASLATVLLPAAGEAVAATAGWTGAAWAANAEASSRTLPSL